jgi:DNA replication protein DnaC
MILPLPLTALMNRSGAKKCCCRDHGKYVAFVTPSGALTRCPVCIEGEIRRDVSLDLKSIAEHNESMRLSVVLPPVFEDKTLDNYVVDQFNNIQLRVVSEANRFVHSFRARNGEVFGMVGVSGCGKTHIAAGIMSAIAKKGYTTKFITMNDMLRSVKSTYRNNSEITENDVIDMLSDPELLVLDDVGVKLESEADRTIMYDVINRRYENEKSLVFTSNLSAQEIALSLGDRVMTRLRSKGTFYSCSWQPWCERVRHG